MCCVRPTARGISLRAIALTILFVGLFADLSAAQQAKKRKPSRADNGAPIVRLGEAINQNTVAIVSGNLPEMERGARAPLTGRRDHVTSA